MGDERDLKKVEEQNNEEEKILLCGIDIHALPEGCIATVVSFTTPLHACRYATISRMFKSASDSDAVWEHFLPSDYLDIISRSRHDVFFDVSLSKKQLFMLLAESHLLLDHGALSFSLDKSTGKKCLTIAPRSLSITWADTPKYWAWRPEPESRFSEVAELLSVCWLEIKGKVQISLLSPDTKYAAYLVFKMSRQAFGFYSPVEVAVEYPGSKLEKGTVHLESLDMYQLVPRRVGFLNQQFRAPLTRVQSIGKEDVAKRPKERPDKWSEVKIGEFLVRADEDGEVEFSVMEVRAGNWKGGLVIEGIEIRPQIK